MDKLRKRADVIFRKQGGYAQSKDLVEGGLHTSQIKELMDSGYIYKVKRGLYHAAQIIEGDHQELLEVANIIPHGVICLLSALSFHGLTTYLPKENYVAIHRHARKPVLPEFPPIRIFYFSDVPFNLGIAEVEIGGMHVNIYDKEKTLCDMVKYRKKLGQDLVKEAFKEYFSKPDIQIEKLLYYAAQTRVRTIVEQYLEVLI